MICPVCGARNGDRARWCTQCYTVLGSDDPPAPAVDPGDPAAADGPSETPPPGPAVPGSFDVDGAAGDGGPDPAPGGPKDVRVTDDQVEWRCSTCGAWSSLPEPACRGCGSPRAGFTPEDHRVEPRPRAGSAASLAGAALLPGLGHLLQGRVGLGSAVLMLWSLWVVGAFVSRTDGMPIAVVLALAAVALWVGSLVDLWQRLQQRPPLLTGRVLAWSTVGVTLLLVLVAIGGGLGAGG